MEKELTRQNKTSGRISFVPREYPMPLSDTTKQNHRAINDEWSKVWPIYIALISFLKLTRSKSLSIT